MAPDRFHICLSRDTVAVRVLELRLQGPHRAPRVPPPIRGLAFDLLAASRSDHAHVVSLSHMRAERASVTRIRSHMPRTEAIVASPATNRNQSPPKLPVPLRNELTDRAERHARSHLHPLSRPFRPSDRDMSILSAQQSSESGTGPTPFSAQDHARRVVRYQRGQWNDGLRSDLGPLLRAYRLASSALTRKSSSSSSQGGPTVPSPRGFSISLPATGSGSDAGKGTLAARQLLAKPQPLSDRTGTGLAPFS